MIYIEINIIKIFQIDVQDIKFNMVFKV
jgi:hypothetical protein